MPLWLGSDHGFALDPDGAVVAFGHTEAGALAYGVPHPDGTRLPTRIELPGYPLSMAAESSHSAAILRPSAPTDTG